MSRPSTNVVIIVAVAENGVIGSENRLPWRLPDDLKRFKALTLGKPVLMGRRTFESIGKPLPGRTNIVVTRQSGLALDGCVVVRSVEAGLAAAAQAPEIAVIGGAQIFEQLLPRTSTIHLTRVHAHVDGDVHFPSLDPREWHATQTEHHPADARHLHAFTFITLGRSKP
jgi:dihydrofolate reductase